MLKNLKKPGKIRTKDNIKDKNQLLGFITRLVIKI